MLGQVLALLLSFLLSLAGFAGTYFSPPVEMAQAEVAPVMIELEEPESTEEEISLIFGGDVMMSRFVGKAMEKHGFGVVLEEVVPVLSSADIAFINLESPFHTIPLFQPEGAQFRADLRTISSLVNAGIDVISLANNHFGDGRREGMKITMDHIEEHGMYYVGAGETPEEAAAPLFLEEKGVTVGYLAYSDVTPLYAANSKLRGYALLPDLDTFAEQVASAAAQSDILVVSLHTGTEFSSTPTEEQVAYSRSAIDAGAQVVVGHHPHLVQPVERYGDGIIAYSLGNLVFDQEQEGADQGLLLEVVFEGDMLLGHEEIPVVIKDYWKPYFVE